MKTKYAFGVDLTEEELLRIGVFLETHKFPVEDIDLGNEPVDYKVPKSVCELEQITSKTSGIAILTEEQPGDGHSTFTNALGNFYGKLKDTSEIELRDRLAYQPEPNSLFFYCTRLESTED